VEILSSILAVCPMYMDLDISQKDFKVFFVGNFVTILTACFTFVELLIFHQSCGNLANKLSGFVLAIPITVVRTVRLGSSLFALRTCPTAVQA